MPLQLALSKSALAACRFLRKARVCKSVLAREYMTALAVCKPVLARHKREPVAARMYLAEHNLYRQALVRNVAEPEARHRLDYRNCGRFRNRTHYRSGFVLVQ